MQERGVLRIGTAGWSYPDWKGVVYPRRAGESFDALRYLAAYFDTIEINSTFYKAPEARVAARWAETVRDLPRFRFVVKLQKEFTHVSPRAWQPGELERFLDGIAPLAEAGLLGALLAQFPFYFAATQDNLRHLERIAESFSLAPLVVELRHRSFLAPPALDLLVRRRLSFCNIDQPLGRDSIEPGARVSAGIGYLRLHGRNREAWFQKGAGRDAKYDYLYSAAELKGFVPLVEELVRKTRDTYVIANNHYLGKGAVNALELKGLLGGLPVEVPPALLEAYPRLEVLAAEGSGR